MPTPTDLVTDLPADFEVFGQAVATSMADLLGGTTDQVLAKNSNADMDFKWVTSDDANAIQNTQLTAKGALITAFSSATPATLTVGANNTFLRANSSTATGLEYAGAYTTFTPSYFNLTVGNGTNTGRYLQIGNFVHAEYKFVFGSTSSIAGAVFPNFPVNANSTNDNNIIGQIRYLDIGSADYYGPVFQTGTSNFLMNVLVTNATYASTSTISSTVPFTWTTGDTFHINIVYEAA